MCTMKYRAAASSHAIVGQYVYSFWVSDPTPDPLVGLRGGVGTPLPYSPSTHSAS